MDAKELGQQPAYPTTEMRGHGGNYSAEIFGGLTKREEFAKAAMQAVYESAMRQCDVSGHPLDWREGVARDAVRLADALLAELAK